MRRLALSVWIAVIASTVIFTLFWRIDYLRPHALWGALSLLSVAVPLVGLTCIGGVRIVRGPNRLGTVGWLLIGVTPIVWVGGYLFQLNICAREREPLELSKPMRIAVVWGSSVMDLEAHRKYSRWTYGRHAVLMDRGQTPDAERLVAEMDQHIESMASLLGQDVPEKEFPWVRGSLFGQNGRAVFRWALCGHADDPAEVTYLDRHEVAHTLITALGGPDHDPPFLLIEGWAESQSSDRNHQIQNLAERYRNNTFFSLQELVDSDWYYRGSGPVYWQGGPLTHYLMQHYTPEVFFELYAGVRRKSFHEDCQRILGDSWVDVEAEFWNWVDAEATKLAETNPEAATQYAAQVELSEGVDPGAWQMLSDGYRGANREPLSYPTDSAFVIHLEHSRTDKDATAKDAKYEFRAVFDEGECWIAENYSAEGDRFLMATDRRSANLHRDAAGELTGWTRGSSFSTRVRHEAIDLLKLYRSTSDPEQQLPFRDSYAYEVSFRIENLIPPSDTNKGWKIEYTRQSGELEPVHCRVTLDPEQRWWITSLLSERGGEFRMEFETTHEQVGDLFMPVAYSGHSTHGQGEYTSTLRLQPLSDAERRELQMRVENVCASGPATSHQRWRWCLTTVSVACPAVGLLLLFKLRG